MKMTKDRLNRVMVIGATPAGIAAVNKLGELGIPVTLVDSEADVDRRLAREEWKLKTGMGLNHAHRPGLIRIFRNPGIACILPARITAIKHSPQGFRVGLTRPQTYIDPEKCTLCGRCLSICPVTKAGDEKAVELTSRRSLPGRVVIDKRRTPLCRTNCPLGVNVQGYVALAKAGRFDQALALIRENNVLPGICGRICTHPCETQCRRGELEGAVAIRGIKRFLADYETETGRRPRPFELGEKRTERIAVIGSGPAGLAAAAEFARFGFKVTVFEKEALAGGLLRYGIGSHRLPRPILERELDHIADLGVDFKTDHPIDLKQDLNRLAAEYHAVLLCTGTWKDRKLGVPGENLPGVQGCLAFLSDFHQGKIGKLPWKAAVIGDGNAAYDLARTLTRLGAQVTIVSWFDKKQIPADTEETTAAEAEGIVLQDNTQVVEFLDYEGRFARLRCRPTQPGEKDPAGIAWPKIKAEAQAFELPFDLAFVAIGQVAALKSADLPEGLELNAAGFIQVDENCKTSLPRVYAAGDAALGPSTVVQAMAKGKAAAGKILQDEFGIAVPGLGSPRPLDKDFDEIPQDLPVCKRAEMPELPLDQRGSNFTEVALGLAAAQVQYEAERCLQCGGCAECLQCVEACRAVGAVDHAAQAQSFMEQTGVIIIADPDLAPGIKGEDVIRAYGPASSRPDVYDLLVRGYAAAAQALVLLGKDSQGQKGQGWSFARPDPGLAKDVRIGVFVCRCNDALGWLDQMDDYIQTLEAIPDVAHVEVLPAACIPQGTAAILKAVRAKDITRIALASCVCCSLNFVCSACTDQRSRLKNFLFSASGIGRSMAATCNIRGEALSLIHRNPEQAFQKFTGLLDRVIRNSRRLKLLATPARMYNFATAVIGESEAAKTSALTLAAAGREVYLFGSGPLKESPLLQQANIFCFENAAVTALSGTLGDFQITLTSNGVEKTVQVGAVILDDKSRRKIPYIHQKGLAGGIVDYAMQAPGVTGTPFYYPGMTSISGLFLADPPGIHISARQTAAAAAILAAAVMPRGPRQSKGYTVNVDPEICRGCGRCLSACLYQAVSLQPNSIGGWHAVVDEAFCKGCGNCISVCPSNAADSPYRSQTFLERSIEAILLQ